jgi:hypothetical protein
MPSVSRAHNLEQDLGNGEGNPDDERQYQPNPPLVMLAAGFLLTVHESCTFSDC